MPSKTGVKAHDDAVLAAEGVRQTALAIATTQAAATSAAITFFRACVTSAVANGVGTEQFRAALRELGTGGV
jgi:hypothetical protein